MERHVRRMLAKRLALLSAVCPMLFSSRAEAETWSAGLGAFVGYSFGQREGISWGFEIFGMSHFEKQSCSNQALSGVGPLLQFEAVGLHDPRLTFALHAGREIRHREAWVTGELGPTYRWGSDPGFGLHMGAVAGYDSLLVAMRAQLFLDDYAAVAGVRFPGPFGSFSECIGIPGRPLRARSGIVSVGERGRRVSRAPMSRLVTRDADDAARAWERDAQHECASVPAFLQLARELLAHEAPPGLIGRALDAACDEIRHAELCAAMASRLLGVTVRPTLPDFDERPVASLTQIARESWLDGCLGEGASATKAARAARTAQDPLERAAHARIARDELCHAVLAWDVLRWAVARGASLPSA
jgi:hypothetical protein